MVNNQPYTTEVNPRAINRINGNHIEVNNQIFETRIIYNCQPLLINHMSYQTISYGYLLTIEPLFVFEVSLMPPSYKFKTLTRTIMGISY
jgi:hypothetical protein